MCQQCFVVRHDVVLNTTCEVVCDRVQDIKNLFNHDLMQDVLFWLKTGVREISP